MRRYRVSPEAKQDLREIRDYIARDNVGAARRVLANLKGAFENLARMPEQGHKREDLTDKPVLFWPVGSYVIVYTQPPDTNRESLAWGTQRAWVTLKTGAGLIANKIVTVIHRGPAPMTRRRGTN
jgi:plasmid stabilization system protein ParE